MNKKARQIAKNPIENFFFKLLNNGKFGYDCCNNLDNRVFEPIIDEINDISCIKKYCSIFDNDISDFINSDLIVQNLTKA